MKQLAHLLGSVVYLTGLPAAGKTTLARGLVAALHRQELPVLWLDSDALRAVLTPEPTYSESERNWFYGVLGALARLGAEGGCVVVVSATAWRRAWRDEVREKVRRFHEVDVRCNPEVLRRRDPKGLYARADRGELTALPGVGVPYEPAIAEDAIVIDTTVQSEPESLEALFAAL